MLSKMPSVPQVECCLGADRKLFRLACRCNGSERALRAWSTGRAPAPMTAEQRDWCVQELDGAGYCGDAWSDVSDAEIAGALLSAWSRQEMEQEQHAVFMSMNGS